MGNQYSRAASKYCKKEMLIGRLGHLPLWSLTRGGVSRIAGGFVWSLAWTPSTEGRVKLNVSIKAGKVHVGDS
jgi:hypothetical protein